MTQPGDHAQPRSPGDGYEQARERADAAMNAWAEGQWRSWLAPPHAAGLLAFMLVGLALLTAVVARLPERWGPAPDRLVDPYTWLGAAVAWHALAGHGSRLRMRKLDVVFLDARRAFAAVYVPLLIGLVLSLLPAGMLLAWSKGCWPSLQVALEGRPSGGGSGLAYAAVMLQAELPRILLLSGVAASLAPLMVWSVMLIFPRNRMHPLAPVLAGAVLSTALWLIYQGVLVGSALVHIRHRVPLLFGEAWPSLVFGVGAALVLLWLAGVGFVRPRFGRLVEAGHPEDTQHCAREAFPSDVNTAADGS